jgi:hypothetical protein
MKKKSMMILIAITCLIAVWSLWSWNIVRSLEKPQYEVLSRDGSFEIRQYAPYIVAQTTVSGPYGEALNNGFRNIATYIFGGNVASSSIAMTTPVLEEKESSRSEKISMTTPVLEQGDDTQRIVSFVMPGKYTMESLPKPLSDNVQLRVVPERKIAALSYSIYTTQARIEKKKQELQSLLEDNNLEIKGEIVSARYNPPFSMPLFIHNEVMVEIQ